MDNNTQDPTGEAPSNIVINGVEYAPEDAQSLIELGNKTRDLEKQWNTPVDKVWPEYGKATTTLKQREAELQQARSELESFKAKQNAGTDTEVDFDKAKEALRKLNVLIKDDFDKEGYIKKADLDSYLEERDSKKEAVRKVLDEAGKLESEIDGKDGRPKFNKKAVLAYAQAYGHSDLMKAYEELNADTLGPWKEAQLAASKKPSLKTLGTGGGKKEPSEVKVTDDNAKDLLRETLWGAKE